MSLFRPVDVGGLVVDPATGWSGAVVKVSSVLLTRTEVEELIAALKEALER